MIGYMSGAEEAIRELCDWLPERTRWSVFWPLRMIFLNNYSLKVNNCFSIIFRGEYQEVQNNKENIELANIKVGLRASKPV